MRERPILFSGPMVRAILEGRKTQTRRVMRVQPDAVINWDNVRLKVWHNGEKGYGCCPYGLPGDRLWVRETFDFLPDGRPGERDNCVIVYGADGATEHRTAPADYNPMIYNRQRWRPSIHMPRWASRNIYDIVAVQPQRLLHITPEDVAAEGLARLSKDGGRTWKWGLPDRDGQPGTDDHGWPWERWDADPVRAYLKLWDQINAARGFSSDKNPWVWAITYRDVTTQAKAEAA